MLISGFIILALGFIPMFAYALALWWLDRFEKEPLALIALAFVWGAVPSILLALFMQMALDAPLSDIRNSNQLTYDLVGASVIAPITEEFVKALALIVLLLLMRHEIDSPVDGLLYGGLIGFGFAAVENTLYFLSANSFGGLRGVIGLAFLRAGVFGLNHAMYSAFTGLGVALALEMDDRSMRPVPILAGFTVAVGVHAVHNALSTFTSYGAALSLLVAALLDWMGVFVLLVVVGVTFWLERRRIEAYGERLVQSRVIPADELDTLSSTLQRRRARLAALMQGDLRRWRLTQRYHQKVTEAAFAWHRVRHGDTDAQARLTQLEAQARTLRQEMTGVQTVS